MKECGVGTGAIFNPKMKLPDANWWGTLGKQKSVTKSPIKHWVKNAKKTKS